MNDIEKVRNAAGPDTSSRADEMRNFYFKNITPNRSRMCQKCPGCIRTQTINEYCHEATPLLQATNVGLIRDARCCDKLLIAMFLLLLLIGSTVGTFLLIFESQDAVIEEFDFVARERWGVNSTFLKDLAPLNKPVSKVLLLELTTNCTNNSNTSKPQCLEYEKFVEDNKEKIKIFSGEVSYNFYQDQNGKIFEGRGWNFQSECGQENRCDDVLTVGVLEDPNVPPTNKQIQKLKAFLDYGVMDNDLRTCYEIMVNHTGKRYFHDLATALMEMNRRDRSCKYYF